MSVKLSAPALPILQYKFHTDAIYLKIAGTIYLFAFSFAQLIYGAISKYHHRRHMIFVSLGIGCIGTLISMISPNVTVFIVGRIIEALGLGGGSTLCRVLMADKLGKHEIAHVTVFFGIIYSANPFVSPTIGQYIIILLSWRWIFGLFLVLIIVYWILTYFLLEETKPILDQKFSFPHLLRSYFDVLSHPVFWTYILGFCLYVGLMIGYYMAIPFWYYEHFGVSEKYYTFLALFTAVPNVIAYYSGRFFVKKHKATGTLRIAYLIGILGLAASVVLLFFKPTPASYIIPLIFIAFSTGLIQPSTSSGLLTQFRQQAGIVSAFIPIFGVGMAGVMFLILTNINLNSLWPFTLILFIIIGFGILSRPWLQKHASHL